MIYLHHRRAAKFSPSFESSRPNEKNLWSWALRIVESWKFHSGRSTFLGKVSGKMRYRWVGNSEILVGYDAHLPPSSSATLFSKVMYRVCRYIRGKLFQESRQIQITKIDMIARFNLSTWLPIYILSMES